MSKKSLLRLRKVREGISSTTSKKIKLEASSIPDNLSRSTNAGCIYGLVHKPTHHAVTTLRRWSRIILHKE